MLDRKMVTSLMYALISSLLLYCLSITGLLEWLDYSWKMNCYFLGSSWSWSNVKNNSSFARYERGKTSKSYPN